MFFEFQPHRQMGRSLGRKQEALRAASGIGTGEGGDFEEGIGEVRSLKI